MIFLVWKTYAPIHRSIAAAAGPTNCAPRPREPPPRKIDGLSELDGFNEVTGLNVVVVRIVVERRSRPSIGSKLQ